VKRPQDLSDIAEDVQTNMSEDVQGPSQALEPTEPDVAMHPPPPPTVPALTHTGRPQRAYRLPARYEDIHPEGPAPLPSASSFPPMAPGSLALPRVILHVRDFMKTGYNRFGLMREYPHRPSYDPDAFVRHADLSNYPQSQPIHLELPASHEPPWPFRNMSIYRLMEWMITGSNQKSVREMDRLAKDVLGAEDFKLKDLAGFSARQENIQLDNSERDSTDTPYSCDGWVESAIEISVPCGLKDNNGLGRPFSIPGLQHRSLLAVMKAALADVTARRFHFSPFRRIWKSQTGVEERCFDEAYTSDAWLEAHDKLQKQSNEPDCKLEKVVLGLMFWSDSTHLASFGTASVWPLYLYFANLSKYFRGRPNSGASHHVAYIPSVSVSVIRPLNIL
jgi:hypothetical protein